MGVGRVVHQAHDVPCLDLAVGHGVAVVLVVAEDAVLQRAPPPAELCVARGGGCSATPRAPDTWGHPRPPQGHQKPPETTHQLRAQPLAPKTSPKPLQNPSQSRLAPHPRLSHRCPGELGMLQPLCPLPLLGLSNPPHPFSPPPHGPPRTFLALPLADGLGHGGGLVEEAVVRDAGQQHRVVLLLAAPHLQAWRLCGGEDSLARGSEGGHGAVKCPPRLGGSPAGAPVQPQSRWAPRDELRGSGFSGSHGGAPLQLLSQPSFCADSSKIAGPDPSWASSSSAGRAWTGLEAWEGLGGRRWLQPTLALARPCCGVWGSLPVHLHASIPRRGCSW